MMHGGSPLRKLEVLEALDKAKTQWYHFTTIIVAGAGFFTDAYDLFCISTVTSLLGRIYYSQPATGKPGVLPINVLAAVNAVALCGTLVGNVVFGWLGDKIGRRTVYGWTLTLMIVCSIGSGISFGSTAKSVMATICFFRFWLGFGIGGDYPLSATIMSEYSNIRTRGAFIAAVFAMQGFGILSGATVGIIVSSVFMHAYPRGSFLEDPTVPPQADYVWRIILMLGAVPAAVTLYYRLRLPETARYTALVQGDIDKAGADMVAGKMLDVQHTARGTGMENWKPRIPRLLSMEFAAQHGWQLLATASCWFLLDVSFFSQNLFQKDIFIAVGWLPPPADMSALEELFRISRASALIALCATIPGYWVTVFTVEWLGRRFVQMQGFFFMAVFMLIIALEFQHFRGYSCPAPEGLMSGSFCGGNHVGFVLLYAVIFFFSNFGPNATTFIIPAELFPASLRATCFGISAAAGKLGAIVGAFGFLYARQARSKHDPDAEAGYPAGIGVKLAYVMLAGVNVVGFLVTALLTPETKGKSLEALSRDLHVDVGRTEDRMPLSEEFDPSGEMRQAQQVPRSPGLRKVQVYSMI